MLIKRLTDTETQEYCREEIRREKDDKDGMRGGEREKRIREKGIER